MMNEAIRLSLLEAEEAERKKAAEQAKSAQSSAGSAQPEASTSSSRPSLEAAPMVSSSSSSGIRSRAASVSSSKFSKLLHRSTNKHQHSNSSSPAHSIYNSSRPSAAEAPDLGPDALRELTSSLRDSSLTMAASPVTPPTATASSSSSSTPAEMRTGPPSPAVPKTQSISSPTAPIAMPLNTTSVAAASTSTTRNDTSPQSIPNTSASDVLFVPESYPSYNTTLEDSSRRQRYTSESSEAPSLAMGLYSENPISRSRSSSIATTTTYNRPMETPASEMDRPLALDTPASEYSEDDALGDYSGYQQLIEDDEEVRAKDTPVSTSHRVPV